jgi:hypothetical protein
MALQAEPQLIPPVLDVTVPAPAPDFVTAIEASLTTALKAAVTDRAAVIVTTQGELVQAPPKPANVEPLAAVAVSVTIVPLATLAEQVVPQLIGPPATVPLPVPDFVTLRV